MKQFKHICSFFMLLYVCSTNIANAQVLHTEKRIVNGVEYKLCRWSDTHETFAKVSGYTSSIPENLTLPTGINLFENTVYDGTYPLDGIESSAFESCTRLKTIKIPAANMGENAFKDCINLYSVDWEHIYSNELVDNTRSVFEGCTKLTTVHLPNELTYIDYYAFKNCSSLKEINIPTSVTGIADEAFSGCASLEQITIPSSVQAIEDRAFYNCTGLTEITIPSSVKRLSGRTFGDCTSLKSVIIEDGTESLRVGSYNYYDNIPAFGGCNVEHLYLGRNIPSNECEGSFKYIKSLEIGPSIQYINNNLFQNFTNLTSVKLPESLLDIRSRAFYGCSSLSRIYSNIANPQQLEVGSSCFDGISPTCTLYVPKGDRQYYGKKSNMNSIRFIKEYDRTYVSNTSEINKSKVYRLEPEEARRGIIFVRQDANYLDACGGIFTNPDIIINDDDPYQQFAIYNCNDDYYLYNIGKQMFVNAYETVGTNMFFKMSTEPKMKITISPSSTDDEFVFIVGGKEWINVSNYEYGCVGNWETEDGGNRISIVEVGNISEETLQTIENALNISNGISWNQTEIDTNNSETFYDIAGRKLSKPQRGLNILRMSDGTVKKVMVK